MPLFDYDAGGRSDSKSEPPAIHQLADGGGRGGEPGRGSGVSSHHPDSRLHPLSPLRNCSRQYEGIGPGDLGQPCLPIPQVLTEPAQVGEFDHAQTRRRRADGQLHRQKP